MPSKEGLDDVWRSLGTWNRFHVFHMVIIVINSLPESWIILSGVFTGYIPEYSCADAEVPQDNSNNDTYYYNKYHKCSYDNYLQDGNTTTLIASHDCKHFKYEEDRTYATEWNLVCSRTNLAALAQSLVLAGQGIGAFTMSHLADRFGRKTIHVVSHLGVLATTLIIAFSNNITMLLALRLVAGTFQQGMVCTGKILLLEMFPTEVRSHMEAATFLSWTAGIMSLTLFGYAFRDLDWRYMQIGLAIFSVYAIFEWWMIDESVRWLLSNGKVEQAEKVIRKAARWNNVDYSKVEKVWKEHLEEVLEKNTNVQENGNVDPPQKENMNGMETKSETLVVPLTAEKVKKYTVLDILKNPALRVNTFILWYAWIVATGTYYGLTLVSSHLAGDRFINFFLSGVIEAPSLILEFYLFNKIGRKKTLILWYAISGVSLILSTLLLTVLDHIHAFTLIATALSLIGKSTITGAFSTVFLYTPEIYPTNYRNSGLGIASSISRIGGILAPFASNLALIALWIPGAIFGGMCLLTTLLALRLPESARHELPKTIAECDKWENASSESSNSTEMMSLNPTKDGLPI